MMVAAASTLAMMPAIRASADAPIQVNVNGGAVNFTSVPPVEVDGSVLVPLRGVFEAMGAGVVYDSDSHTITARKGDRTVILPLGSTTASVNGQSQTLSQPARVEDGTTLVPLRFVAEALGGYVEWESAQNTVDITTADSHLSELPPAPGAGRVIGQLTGVFTDTNPQQITVRVNGDNTTVPITGSTVVLRAQRGTDDREVALTDISIGDQVTVDRDDQGYAKTITATYGELRGTIKSIEAQPDGSHIVTLNDGNTVQLVPDARLRMNGRHIGISDIMPDEHVLIRTNPANGEGYELLLNPQPPVSPAEDTGIGAPEAAGPLVTSFDVDAPSALRAGDVLHVTLKGTTGGTAVFSIPGAADSVAIPEVSAGVYQTDFQVPDGITIEKGTALARLTVLGNTSPLIQASEPVTIDSIAPKVGARFPETGTVVENGEPLIYAVLTDPGGVGIDTSRSKIFVDGQDVTGSANVSASYVDFKPSAPLGSGQHDVRVVVVDSLGNKSSTDWPFSVADHRLIDRFDTDVQPGTILSSGQTIKFTMQGPADGDASVSIPGVAHDIKLHQREPGIYRGEYTVQPGDNAAECPVVGHLRTLGGHDLTTVLSNGLNVAGGTPAVPVIITPTDGSTADGTINVSGTAPPLSTVRVKVRFDTKAAGDLVDLTGTSATREVTADVDGNWTIGALSIDSGALLSSRHNTHYTITAETVDPTGERSAEASISIDGGHVYAHRTGQE
jgi:hypothetical protein